MQRSATRAQALWLSYFTVGYNLIEGLASVVVGLRAGSIALVGFALDSFFETLSGAVMVWRFRRSVGLPEEADEEKEGTAVKLVGVTFVLLGCYVLYESVHKLITHEIPARSLLGIIIAIASLIVMPILYRLKIRTGQALGSRSLVADAKETLVCSLLSVALLFGLGLNYLFGLWWADPVAGMLIVGYLFKEAYEALVE